MKTFNSLKDKLKNIFNQIFKNKNRVHFPIYFLRISQALSLISLLSLLMSILGIGITEVSSSTQFFSILLYMMIIVILSIVTSEVAVRLLKKKNITGFWLTLLLAILHVFSNKIGLIIGLFGLYGLFNPDAQKKYLHDAPLWFKNILLKCRIYWI